MKSVFAAKICLLSAILCGLLIGFPTSLLAQRESASVLVNFPNSPVSAVLPYYETLTEKKIIQDANLTGVNLTIASAEPMTKREAIAFIDSIFLLNGYAFIPVDENTLKLVNVTGGKNPRSQGLPVVSRATDLPDGDSVVNYIMTLENISPEDAVRTFSQVVTLNPYGAITPLSNASGVIITENTAVIRSLIELKDHVDVPPAQVASEFIKLHRADAEKIADMISTLYEARTGVAPVVGVNGANAAAASGQKPGATTAKRGGENSNGVFIIPYRRTNSLLVMARPVDVRYIEGLVKSFDEPSDGVHFLKRTLQYVSISDYLPAFHNAIARGTDIEKREDFLESQEQQESTGSLNRNPVSTAGAGGISASQITAPDRLTEPADKGRPQSVVVGNTLLIADPQANSLIVSGSPEHLEIVDQLITEIDVQPRQVYISTVIGQLSIGDDFDYALNALQTLESFQVSDKNSLSAAGSLFKGANPAANPISDIASLASASAFPASAAGLSLYGNFRWGSDDASANALLNLFTRDTRFRILSKPSVYAQNNVKAQISSGQRIAVPISTLTSVNNGLNSNFPGSIASNIEYRDVVLKLEVIPLINSDDRVTLKIAQLNDNITGSQNISGNEIPTLSTQELITTVTIDNGATIVLGGLITEREEEEVTGVPGIRKIPLLGRVLGSTEKKNLREELLIFIQPHIIPGEKAGALPRTTNDLEQNRSEILEETIEFADPDIEPQAHAAPVRQPAPEPKPRFRLFQKHNHK
ncbi:MAG: hypothetical protein HKN23_20890 [Verrucomicrobiales bacterium]|nr:hypothetical protein [Verrucomicrobiales bacterium]